MTNYGNTTFRGLRKLLGNNPIHDVDEGIAALADDVDAQLGSHGKSIVAAEESLVTGAYGLMPTPDHVAGIVVPTDGLLIVNFRALVKQTVTTTNYVAIFIGSNQAKLPVGTGAPAVMETTLGTDLNDYNWVYTSPSGGMAFLGGAGNASSVTTGMAAGQSVAFEVAAGTYDVSVQYKCTGLGVIFAKERKLRVWTKPF
jgi:hypothetical protein